MTNRHEHWYKYVINFLLVYIIIKWKRSIRSDWELSEKILMKKSEWTRFDRYLGSIFHFLSHVLTNILWIRPWTPLTKKTFKHHSFQTPTFWHLIVFPNITIFYIELKLLWRTKRFPFAGISSINTQPYRD